MSKTTIELTESKRDALKAERLPHESNYSETIARLLGDSDGGQLWTQSEIEDIVDNRIEAARRTR